MEEFLYLENINSGGLSFMKISQEATDVATKSIHSFVVYCRHTTANKQSFVLFPISMDYPYISFL